MNQVDRKNEHRKVTVQHDIQQDTDHDLKASFGENNDRYDVFDDDLRYSTTNQFSADSSAPGYDNMYDEEYAAEVAVPHRTLHTPEVNVEKSNIEQKNVHETVEKGSRAGMWGAIALFAAIASWIVWPTVLAPVGAIAGAVAFIKGRRGLGGWAVALSLISFFIFMSAAY